MEYWVKCFIAVSVCSYLLGCFNGAILTARNFYKADIREYGSKNAGLTNFYRTFGVKGMLGVALVDIIKAAVSMLLAYWLLEPFGLIKEAIITAMFFCMLGHIFPAFFEFRGGKGVLTAACSAFMFDWRCGLILLAVFVVTVAITRYVSLGSILGGAVFPLSIWFFGYSGHIIFMAVCCALLMITMHRANIKRLLSKTENKLSFRRGEQTANQTK